MAILPDAESFHRIVDGTARGPAAAAARLGLSLLEPPYRLAVIARNRCYDHGLRAIRRAAVPVVSVGNLTLGGTGKTPLVAWLAASLLEAGHQPAVVSRGYAAVAGEVSDEAAELAVLLPEVPHVANPDRLAAAAEAASQGADVVLLDDGFQHRRLARDLDLVAIDATDPFGCGRVFPRGLLREPLDGLARADAAVLTRASRIDRSTTEAIHAAVCRHAGRDIPWATTTHAPRRLRTAGGELHPLELLAGMPVAIVAGIGNPAAFRATVEALGGRVAMECPFPDHHRYDESDAESIGRRAAAVGAELVVTTLKDLVKLRRDTLAGVPLVAIEIAIEFLEGREAIDKLLSGLPLHPQFRSIRPCRGSI